MTDNAATERNKALLGRFFSEVVTERRLEVLDEVLAPEMVEQARAVAQMWHRAFSDLRVEVDDMVAEGDRVTATVTITGTHDGPLAMPGLHELPPTGRRATWTGMDWVRISNGRIVERRSPRDLLSMLRQLGAIDA